jgi:hypothetical protein
MDKAYKHTPGPWAIRAEPNPADDGADDIGPVTSAVMTREAFICGGIAIDADARLITAAPALLQCVEELLAVVHDRERDDATVAAVNAAEGLIARVRGDA